MTLNACVTSLVFRLARGPARVTCLNFRHTTLFNLPINSLASRFGGSAIGTLTLFTTILVLSHLMFFGKQIKLWWTGNNGNSPSFQPSPNLVPRFVPLQLPWHQGCTYQGIFYIKPSNIILRATKLNDVHTQRRRRCTGPAAISRHMSAVPTILSMSLENMEFFPW